jgi:hypothetical protein
VAPTPTSAERTVKSTAEDALAEWMDAAEIAALKAAGTLA